MAMISKCSCPNCGVHVEFDASELAPKEVRKGPCPSCGGDMWFFLNDQTSRSKPNPPNVRTHLSKIKVITITAAIAAFGCGLVFLDRPREKLAVGDNPIPMPQPTVDSKAKTISEIYEQASDTERAVINKISSGLESLPARVLASQNQGSNFLHKACFHGQNDVIRILLACGANVNQKDEYGCTPLHAAVRCEVNPIDTISLLLTNRANLSLTDNFGGTPLHDAVVNNKYVAALALLDGGADVNDGVSESRPDVTPIAIAASHNYGDLIDLLLQHKADLSLRDKEGRTALMAAVANDSDYAVQKLIEAGAKVEVEDNNGNTPLLLAAGTFDPDRKPNVKSINLLLSKKTNPNKPDRNGTTPLMISSVKNDISAVEALLKAGANPNLKLKDTARGALFEAIPNDTIGELLIEYGAEVNAKDIEGRTPLQQAYINLRVEQKYVGVLNNEDKLQSLNDWILMLRRHGAR